MKVFLLVSYPWCRKESAPTVINSKQNSSGSASKQGSPVRVLCLHGAVVSPTADKNMDYDQASLPKGNAIGGKVIKDRRFKLYVGHNLDSRLKAAV